MTADPDCHHISFPAMGCTCELTLVGGTENLLHEARRRVAELESRWSRFRDDSEITRLNHRGGRATALSHDTYLLVDHAVTAWHWTQGRYDPTVLHALEAAGYDRSFEHLASARTEPRPSRPAPGCAGIGLDPQLRAVTLPEGVGFDPGGIGKGLATDLVVDLVLAGGAAGACVSLGGDGRVAGEPPSGGWRVGVANPYRAEELLTVVCLSNHGIATSSKMIRRWSVGDRQRHHLLDPLSGESTDNQLDSVTVIAADAWIAEVLTKAAFVAGPDDGASLVAALGAAGLLVAGLDHMVTSGPFTTFVDVPAPGAIPSDAGGPDLV